MEESTESAALIARVVGLHYELQLGTYFDSVHRYPDATVAAGTIPGCIWNHAAVLPGSRAPDEAWVERVAQVLAQMDRPLAVYVESAADEAVDSLLRARDISHVDTEAWMIHTADDSDHARPQREVQLELVDSHDRQAEIEALISESFDGDHGRAVSVERNMMGPYRACSRYLLRARSVAVAGATVCHSRGWAVVHDVCVTPDMRGRSLGRELMGLILEAVRPVAAKGLFLQCDAGDLEGFYRACGFETIYVRHGYAAEAPA